MLNHRGSVTQSPKLSEVLFEQRDRSFRSLAAMPSNVEAIEAALLFSTSMNPLVAVVGPSGWGKTHLLQAVGYRLTLNGQVPSEAISVPDYLTCSGRAEPGQLILDDVQEVLGKPKQRLALQIALERRVRAIRPTILAFTALKPNRQLKGLLPSARDWTVVTMGEPQPAERVLLLNQMSLAEGLSLSPRLIRILADQMYGNGRTLSGALKRLRLSGSTWLDAEETLRALGLLDPFFADNSSWDLKLKILRIAEQSKTQFTRSHPLDLALFTMLHKACLGEADVARVAGISPAAAYQGAARFQRQIASCQKTEAYVLQFIEMIVSGLAKE